MKCPYCGSIHASWEGLEQHTGPCRKRWIIRRAMERKKAGRPALSDAEKRALIAQNVFKGFREEDSE